MKNLNVARIFIAFALYLLGFASVSAFLPRQQQNLKRRDGQQPRHSSLKLAIEGYSLFSEFGSIYTHCLENYYFQTQSATGALFSSLGDAFAQANQRQNSPNETKQQHDWKRTRIYFIKGLGGGIMWSCWYDFADPWSQMLTEDILSMGVRESSYALEQTTRTSISILVEQFFVCPIFYSMWDIPIPALLRGSPMRQIPAQVENKLGSLLIANAKVWTFVNLITYNIPVEFRVLFTSFADIFWQSINAAITSKEIQVVKGDVPALETFSSSQLNSTEPSLTTVVEESVVV